MKVKVLVLTLAAVTALSAGCAPRQDQAQKQQPQQQQQQQEQKKEEVKQTAPNPDVVTTASIVNNGDALLKAVSKEGKWIAATVNDIVIDKEIVVEGQFTYRDAIVRKIALYTQDDKRNVTARFRLQAPKMIIRSENTVLQSGTFVGDVQVEAKGFKLVDFRVDGNVFFTTDEFKNTFTKDDKSTVTKATEVRK